MNDRELLEAAARAAGMRLVLWHADGTPHATLPDDTVSFRWNPLTDDGDALRLAVKLHLNLLCHTGSAIKAARRENVFAEVPIGEDRYAATRRAIVLAAAAIGAAK